MVVPPFYDASSGPSSPSQQERIPAWKKVGLKLKNAKYTKEVVSSTNGVSRSTLKRSSPDTHLAPTAKGSVAEPLAKKRRVESDADKPTRSNSSLARTSDTFPKDQNARLKKKVSFTVETKLEDGGKELITDWERDDYAYYEQKAAENDAKEAQKKFEKSTISSEKPSGTQGKSRDALGYLDLYYRSRSSWKFNKNREVWILRHILSTDDIPTSFNIALASYVHGLGSRQARSRLLNQCQEALEKELAKEYSGDQQDSDSSQMEDPGRRKVSHDDYVRRFKRSLEDHLDDEQRKAREVDPEYQLWVLERKRAEILLWAATPSSSSTEGASTSSRGVRSDPLSFTSVKPANGVSVNGVLPNGHLFKKKNRTVVIEASSSSEDESVISDKEDDGGELVNRKGVPNGVTDSESSSDESSGAASSADSDSNEEESATVTNRSRGSVSPSEDGSETDTEFPSGERQQLAISISSRSNTSTLPVSSTPDETSSSASTDDDEEQDESDSGSSTAAADTRPSMNGDGETTSSSDGEDESQSDSD
jgi:WKF domain